MHVEVQRYIGERFQLTSITHGGRPVFLAREVGQQLKYADRGGRLVTKIREWDELEEGIDYFKVEGEDAKFILNAFRPPGAGGSRGHHAVLLTKAGLYGVCMLSRKKIGREYRRWIRHEAMPAFERGELPSGFETKADIATTFKAMREPRLWVDTIRRVGLSRGEVRAFFYEAIEASLGPDARRRIEEARTDLMQLPLQVKSRDLALNVVSEHEASGAIRPHAADDLRRALTPSGGEA